MDGNIEVGFLFEIFFTVFWVGFAVLESLGDGCDDRVEKRPLLATVNLVIIEPGIISKKRVIAVKDTNFRADISSESPAAGEVIFRKKENSLDIVGTDMLTC